MTSAAQSPPPRPIRRASVSPSRDAGVKGITRKVIRTLEGLGHLDSPQETLESDPLADPADDADDESETHMTMNMLMNEEDNDTDRKVATGKQRAPPVEAKKKIDWEIPRKVLHSSIGFITLGLYLTPSMSPRTVTIVLWIALSIIGTADFVRLRNPAVERVYERALGFLMRESERHGTNGTLWYILGVNFALTFYPIDVATVAILILSWADTAASTIGRAYGSRTPPLPQSVRRLRLPFASRKSTAGFIAACVTGAIVAFMFWVGIAPLLRMEGVAEMRARFGVGGVVGLIATVGCAGVVSAVAEALDLGGLDDNLTLPIISGGALMAFFRLWGWAVGAA
ncbi:hypothetical protein FB45DRAFT_785946 [Roridomyces roridus]|uniref:Phosphatidate cytidylyltransferase n=1 Tax=Roridomyces roridus TaxID=1738132 RepID=A0AAD7FTF2_9AGAR|nr:hypothetical protein FB45DRAFT_785946 [Roridomyces roridus]